jgi:hypothetical protein
VVGRLPVVNPRINAVVQECDAEALAAVDTADTCDFVTVRDRTDANLRGAIAVWHGI